MQRVYTDHTHRKLLRCTVPTASESLSSRFLAPAHTLLPSQPRSNMPQRRRNKAKSDGPPKKPQLTHFLCIPLVTESSRSLLEASVHRFRQETAGTIAEKAMRPIGSLHLTLGVMSLDQHRLEAASQLLRDFAEKSAISVAEPRNTKVVSGPEIGSNDEDRTAKKVPSTLSRPISPPAISSRYLPLNVSMRSLESMHAAHKTSILYVAPTDPSGRLYPLCNDIRTQFMDAGLLIDDKRPLKLHATIVNTIYAKDRRRAKVPQDKSEQIGDGAIDEEDRSSGHGPDANAPLKMDATELLEKYKDFIWAENITLDRVAICEMGVKKELDDRGKVIREEYKEVAIIALASS